MISFKKQFDKLVKAYLEDKVIPTNPCACFVGNLLNGTMYWRATRKYDFTGVIEHVFPQLEERGLEEIERESEGTYTPEEIAELEDVFMNTYCENGRNEEGLYKAFELSLLKLKEIHLSKGEVIEDYTFTKRELQTA